MRFNPDNERVKHRYFRYLSNAKRLDKQTVDSAAIALDRYEAFTSRRAFSEFRADHALAFRSHLLSQVGRSGKPLSRSTIVHTLNAVKRFFVWLPDQVGYKRLEQAWAEYFNPSLREVAIARATRQRRIPTLEQVRRAVFARQPRSSIELRDQALIALIAITGARDNAAASLRLKHIDVDERMIYQDGSDVRTKFGKSISTWFFPIAPDLEEIVTAWVNHLRADLGFGPDDPLFPASVATFENGLAVTSLGRDGWSTAGPIRKVFKEAFESAGMHNFNPHSLRHMLVRIGMEVCVGPEEFKAWSQNLGHEGVLVTFNSYGELPPHLQRDAIRRAGQRSADDRQALDLGYAVLATARRVGSLGQE